MIEWRHIDKVFYKITKGDKKRVPYCKNWPVALTVYQAIFNSLSGRKKFLTKLNILTNASDCFVLACVMHMFVGYVICKF